MLLAFFLGFLGCALALHAGERLHGWIERRERIRVARIRGTAVPEWGVR